MVVVKAESINGLATCTLVFEFNYTAGPSSLASVWLFNGDGRNDLTSTEDLSTLTGWTRIVGPIDQGIASEVHASLKEFLESCGVIVIDEGIAD